MRALKRDETIADLAPLAARPDGAGSSRRALPPPDAIAALAREIESCLAACAPLSLGEHPIEAYLASFAELPAGSQYHAIPPAARATCRAIEAAGGAEAVEAYHRLVLLHLIMGVIARGPSAPMHLTPEALALLDAYLARVVADVAKPRKGFFRHGNDQFAKDFAVCRGRLLPCGVEVLDPLGGIPRRLVFKGRQGADHLRQAVTMARMAWRLGGTKAVWGLHFDRRQIQNFTAKGYADLYLRVADLLEANPEIRGISSGSWWHDPRVLEISPELSFIGTIPENGGAFLIRVGEDDRTTSDALRFAPQRTALHRLGKYRPCFYMLAWARQDVIAWAEAYRAGSVQRRIPVA